VPLYGWHSVDLDVVALRVVDGLGPFLHTRDRLVDPLTWNAQGDPAEASFESCHWACAGPCGARQQEKVQGIQVWRVPGKADWLEVDLLFGVLSLATLVADRIVVLNHVIRSLRSAAPSTSGDERTAGELGCLFSVPLLGEVRPECNFTLADASAQVNGRRVDPILFAARLREVPLHALAWRAEMAADAAFTDVATSLIRSGEIPLLVVDDDVAAGEEGGKLVPPFLADTKAFLDMIRRATGLLARAAPFNVDAPSRALDWPCCGLPEEHEKLE
jgi:hypothetical protein